MEIAQTQLELKLKAATMQKMKEWLLSIPHELKSEIINQLDQLIPIQLKKEKEEEEKKKLKDIDLSNYVELILDQHEYKAGKAWIQFIHDGQRQDFLEPYNIEKIGYITTKTFRIYKIGQYFCCKSGSKKQENRFKIEVFLDELKHLQYKEI